jgi:hypothetical protein
VLLQQEVTELLVSRDDRARCDGQLFNYVLLIRGIAREPLGFVSVVHDLRDPRLDFAPENPDLSCPIFVARSVERDQGKAGAGSRNAILIVCRASCRLPRFTNSMSGYAALAH